MAREYMLTTIDNPFDPFDQFDSWLQFDKEHRYNSSERLMRIAKVSDDMTQHEIDLETERAIDEIIKYDFVNIYKKAVRETADDDEELD